MGTMKKYVIIKPFRHSTGMRFPGEFIELLPSRAMILRNNGLIGEEYISPEVTFKDEVEVVAVGEPDGEVEVEGEPKKLEIKRTR